VPELQQQITVTGYPIGGDSLSITQGIVSRVTMSSYTAGAAQLMNVQARAPGQALLSADAPAHQSALAAAYKGAEVGRRSGHLQILHTCTCVC
jgi:hypothetical protein